MSYPTILQSIGYFASSVRDMLVWWNVAYTTKEHLYTQISSTYKTCTQHMYTPPLLYLTGCLELQRDAMRHDEPISIG